MKRTITLVESLTGFSFHVPHLDGRILLVKSEPGSVTKPGDILAIKDQGFPQLNNPYVRGNLYVEFLVKFPESQSLSESAKATLLTVLPVPDKTEEMAMVKELLASQSAKMADAANSEEGAAAEVDKPTIEDVQLEYVDIEEEKKKFESSRNRQAYEDDEEGGGRRQQAGCRTQ